MPDPTLAAIDRLFDFVDSGVEALDHAFNRGERTKEKHRTRREKRALKVIDVQAESKATKKSGSALVCKPRVYIVESISPSGTLFVVTDGNSARVECATRELAEKILRALEAA